MPKPKPLVRQALLKELYNYDPDTGIFRWKAPRARSRVKAGDVAGVRDKNYGYRLMKIDGQVYKAHRLAWVYVHGIEPKRHLDHINGVRDDNRIANLREATVSQNAMNKKAVNRLKGAHWNGTVKKWQSVVVKSGRQIWLGYFASAEAAHAAYCSAAKTHFGEFANAGICQ